jgi:hypothetical protein
MSMMRAMARVVLRDTNLEFVVPTKLKKEENHPKCIPRWWSLH